MGNVSVNLTLTPILTSSILFSLGPHLPDIPQQCLFISLRSIWLTKLGIWQWPETPGLITKLFQNHLATNICKESLSLRAKEVVPDSFENAAKKARVEHRNSTSNGEQEGNSALRLEGELCWKVCASAFGLTSDYMLSHLIICCPYS